MGKYPSYNCRQLERRLREIGCELLRTAGSHRHDTNPFQPDRLITFSWHPGDVPRGIIADTRHTVGQEEESHRRQRVPRGMNPLGRHEYLMRLLELRVNTLTRPSQKTPQQLKVPSGFRQAHGRNFARPLVERDEQV